MYVLRIVKTLSIVAALASAAQAGALITLHVLPTGYNPRLDAVSDYGVGRYPLWFWAQAVAGGVAGLGASHRIRETTPSIPTLVVVMLLVSGVARFLIPFFPTDQNGNRFQTLPGTIHMILAIVIFASIIIAASKFGSDGRTRGRLAKRQGLALCPAVGDDRRRGRCPACPLRAATEMKFGLLERLFYVSSIAWFLIVSIELARIAG